ncbi:MAG: hypothetical protein QGH42_12560 [Kiritimatiellia bacterium]|jgi:hypothetical protein|nr:hypothetical protein [Kiritimatiellia bacterium]MDP6630510.1 hypothetical protein [Kiritimatiellia bacterium]MDP6809967.1 hypothetical protein [Kiritimatiellia bacterium]MDP7025057.1 hypothetical protein [Kiritimatiellia bacterium]
MRTLLPVILILVAILTVGIAGDWIVDNVSISNRLNQTEASSTNAVMGSLGIGTAAPEAKLHVVGDSKLEGVLDLASNRVVNVAAPVADGDALSKSYVEDLLENVPARGSVSMGVYTNR